MSSDLKILKIKKILAFTSIFIWTAVLIILYILPWAAVSGMEASAGKLISDSIGIDLPGMFGVSQRLITVCFAAFTGFAVLAWLTYYAVNIYDIKGTKKWLFPTASVIILSVVCEVIQLVIPERVFHVADLLSGCFGGVFTIILAALYVWANKKMPRIANPETVSYVFFGVLTTIINIILFNQTYRLLGFYELADQVVTASSNIIAWAGAVIFAYIVNKVFVFKSAGTGRRAAFRELILFIGARLFSLAVDTAGLILLIDVLDINSGISKILMNIVVMVMNYFFSKMIIFKKDINIEKDEQADELL